MVNLFFLFGAVFESILGPILIPKLVQHVLIFGSILDPFFWGLGVLWVPLGSLLGPLEVLLGGLKSEKMPTVQRENHFFINTGLWFFEDPNGPLGLILVPLGQIWSQNGSQHGCKFDQKVGPKIIKKYKKWEHFWVLFRVSNFR